MEELKLCTMAETEQSNNTINNNRDLKRTPVEVRLRNLKERQSDERQKKLEDIKAQALAAQRFRDQKELERRKRLDELKTKEDQRRQQVEERKKAIYQAEQDRLISILRRNQEREARIEAKRRNERNCTIFAFGSSTPRMLEPDDMLTSSFWGCRRSTSTQNITSSMVASTGPNGNGGGPLMTRRQSEREIEIGRDKKRATSVGGLECTDSSNVAAAGVFSGYVGRRRTDLMPTIPARDTSLGMSRKSLNASPASSRPSSALSQQSTTSGTSSSVVVKHRISSGGYKRQRPVSIAVTGVTNNNTSTPKSILNTITSTSNNNNTTNSNIMVNTGKKSDTSRPPLPKTIKKPITTSTKSNKTLPNHNSSDLNIPEKGTLECTGNGINEKSIRIDEPRNSNNTVCDFETKNTDSPIIGELIDLDDTNTIVENANNMSIENFDSTATGKDMEMLNNSKNRITTEEEAIAALQERRRIVREEAERQAELERLRLEAEARAEFEQEKREEEQVQLLIAQQKAAEEQRLEEAIRESQRKDEEERLKREEEQRVKLLKEETDRKAREEAERQKVELQERLKNEEKEREARRKRVEAIMLRTRGKNSLNTSVQQSMEEKDDDNNKVEKKLNGTNNPPSTDQINVTKNGNIVDENIKIIENSIKNISLDTIHNNDSINTNNPWQTKESLDPLL